MDRRLAIKNIGVSFGSITLSTGIISIVQSCQKTESSNLKFFNQKQIGFLDIIWQLCRLYISLKTPSLS